MRGFSGGQRIGIGRQELPEVVHVDPAPAQEFPDENLGDLLFAELLFRQINE